MGKPRVYYNEIDKHACAWLAENMRRGLIPQGDIDERSIELVQPGDVAGYASCHFFAGLGGWAYAGRLAGLPDDYPWWSGSCPCQPFSVAGRRRGSADRRHLWPHLFRLIGACRPSRILGEQVAQAAGWDWFDGVRADLAGAAYQCRGFGLCSCAVDSPDERERIYWGAVADGSDQDGRRRQLQRPGQGQGPNRERTPDKLARCDGGEFCTVVDDPGIGRGEGRPQPGLLGRRGATAGPDAPNSTLVDDTGRRRETRGLQSPGRGHPPPGSDAPGIALGDGDSAGLPIGQSIAGDAREERAATGGADDPAGESRSWYAEAEWIECHDGKKRRAQPGTPMLVARLPGRIPLWRGFGGSINARLAAEVIKAFVEAETETSLK